MAVDSPQIDRPVVPPPGHWHGGEVSGRLTTNPLKFSRCNPLLPQCTMRLDGASRGAAIEREP
jgi:hypothetical protein